MFQLHLDVCELLNFIFFVSACIFSVKSIKMLPLYDVMVGNHLLTKLQMENVCEGHWSHENMFFSVPPFHFQNIWLESSSMGCE